MSGTVDQFCDPIWRISNLYFIINKRGQRVRFVPNEAQIEFLRGCSKRDLILKARQLGFTTLLCIVGLDEAIFNDNWSVAIIAHKLEDAKRIFQEKVKYPYDQLPDELKAARPLVKDAADSLQFANGSKISVTNSARSGTLQRLHISEFGKIVRSFPARRGKLSLVRCQRQRTARSRLKARQKGRTALSMNTSSSRAPVKAKQARAIGGFTSSRGGKTPGTSCKHRKRSSPAKRRHTLRPWSISTRSF